MVGCNEAGYNRDLVRRMVVSCQSLLFLFGRFWQLASAGTACAPDLRQKIAVTIAVENQLGFSLRCVCRRGGRHHYDGPPFRASNQQRGRDVTHFLHSVLTRRERRLPRCELKWNTRNYGLLRSGGLGCCQEGQRQDPSDSA